MSFPKVSIVIPVYNARECIEQTFACVFGQTFSEWELIVFDDGSSDRSAEFARDALNDSGRRCKFLQHEGARNQGQFITRLHAVKACSSETIVFLDADDLWNENYLARHMHYWRKANAAGAKASYGPSLFWYPGASSAHPDRTQSLPSRGAGLYSPGELLDSFIDTLYDCTPCPSCMIVDRDVFLSLERFAVSGRDALGYEDQIVSWYIALHHPVYVHDEVLVKYRQSDNSSSKMTQASKDRATKAELSFIDTIIPEIEGVNSDATALSKLKDRRSHLMKQSQPPSWRQRMTSFFGLANK
jgi:glycosyltransferase involved in cell wall biosynthesis